MQGWGNLVNTAVLCALLAIFGQTGSKYNHYALDAVWRISFGLGLIPVTAMLVYRLFFLQESKVWVRQNKPASVRPLSFSSTHSRWPTPKAKPFCLHGIWPYPKAKACYLYNAMPPRVSCHLPVQS